MRSEGKDTIPSKLRLKPVGTADFAALYLRILMHWITPSEWERVDAYMAFLNFQGQSYYYLMRGTVEPLQHKGWEAAKRLH